MTRKRERERVGGRREGEEEEMNGEEREGRGIRKKSN